MLEMYVEFDSLFQGYRFFVVWLFLFFYYFPEYLNLHACKSEMQFALMYLPHSVSSMQDCSLFIKELLLLKATPKEQCTILPCVLHLSEIKTG